MHSSDDIRLVLQYALKPEGLILIKKVVLSIIRFLLLNKNSRFLETPYLKKVNVAAVLNHSKHVSLINNLYEGTYFLIWKFL